jgi:serine/threonine protein kinase
MSFNRFRKKPVQERITVIQPLNTKSTGNVVRALTSGLNDLYKVIDSQTSWSRSDPNSNADGFLQLKVKPVEPLVLNRRYSHESLVATGTFAQIHLFKDIYTGKSCAIKITKAGCDLLSLRERAFLDHVAMCERRGASFCKSFAGKMCDLVFIVWSNGYNRVVARIRDAFVHDGHTCLVMPFYQGTLMDYVREGHPKTMSTSNSSSLLSTPMGLNAALDEKPLRSDILCPRPMRSSMNMPYVKQNGSSAVRSTPSKPGSVVQREFNSADFQCLKRIAIQLLSALWLLQKEEIIHGDLKPENCFIESGSSNMAPAVQQDTILRNRPSSNSVGRSPLPLHRLGADEVTSNHNSKPLSSLPVDARIKLGDFGNSLHFSEIHQYFEEYEIQSLPYRAPEVLLGLRFTSAIDIWSVGVILIELVIGQTLFHCHNREEAIRDIETTICKLSKTRFSAGKFAHCLFQASRWQAGSPGYVPAPPVTESSQWNRMEQMKSIKRLILRHVSFQSIAPHDLQSLVDFLTSLTAVDPSHRITAFDALQHSFLVAEINLPMSVVIQTVNDAEDAASSSSSKLYKRRRVGTGNPPFHSLKNF